MQNGPIAVKQEQRSFMRRSLSSPSETLESVREFWQTHINNEYYTTQHRGSTEYFDEIERRRYRWHYHLRDLFQELEGSSGRLLEIGCGIGVDSIQLARCGFDVTAVYLTESAIDVARAFSEARDVRIDFRVSNAEKLEFGDKSFDVVYSFGVLHHTPQIEKAVAEVHRVLKPGGTAYLMLYHRNSLVNLIHRLFRLPYESPRNLEDRCPVVYTFTRRAAADLFKAFSRVEVHTDYPFTYGFRHVVFGLPKSLLHFLGRSIGWHIMIRATR